MFTKRFVLILTALLMLCSLLSARHFARWNTSMGDFTAELYEELVPITANNFIDLANSGFYQDLIFHRVISGFMIQDGCPYGTGYGGPGYTIPDEYHPDLNHDQAGILAMARTSAPNSAGSQYYITLAPQPHLNGNYAVFGKVIQGLDVVMAIGNVPVNANNLPLTPVTIDTLRILDLIIGEATPPASDTFVCDANVPQMFIIEAYAYQSALSYTWSVDGVVQGNAIDFIFEQSFLPGTHTVSCIVASADWQHEIIWNVSAEGTSVNDDLLPVLSGLRIYPNPFSGDTTISFVNRSKSPAEVQIYDLRGRVIRKHHSGSFSGSQAWKWDAKDMNNNPCPAGIYIIHVKAGNEIVRSKCMLY